MARRLAGAVTDAVAAQYRNTRKTPGPTFGPGVSPWATGWDVGSRQVWERSRSKRRRVPDFNFADHSVPDLRDCVTGVHQEAGHIITVTPNPANANGRPDFVS